MATCGHFLVKHMTKWNNIAFFFFFFKSFVWSYKWKKRKMSTYVSMFISSLHTFSSLSDIEKLKMTVHLVWATMNSSGHLDVWPAGDNRPLCLRFSVEIKDKYLAKWHKQVVATDSDIAVVTVTLRWLKVKNNWCWRGYADIFLLPT